MTIAIFGGNDGVRIISDGPEVDVKTGEYHTLSATPTRFTIESGANASDHIIENPDGLEVTWAISNTDSFGSSYGNRAANVLDSLRALIKRRALYQVVTRHRLYESMAIEAVTADHIGPFTGALRGRIIFSEVPVRPLERAEVPESMLDPSVSKTASSGTQGGRVEPKVPSPADAQRGGSLLSQIRG